MKSPLFKTICYGLAMAMGVAVIVTNIVAPQSLASVTTLLAIGIAAIGIVGLQ